MNQATEAVALEGDSSLNRCYWRSMIVPSRNIIGQLVSTVRNAA